MKSLLQCNLVLALLAVFAVGCAKIHESPQRKISVEKVLAASELDYKIIVTWDSVSHFNRAERHWEDSINADLSYTYLSGFDSTVEGPEAYGYSKRTLSLGQYRALVEKISAADLPSLIAKSKHVSPCVYHYRIVPDRILIFQKKDSIEVWGTKSQCTRYDSLYLIKFNEIWGAIKALRD